MSGRNLCCSQYCGKCNQQPDNWSVVLMSTYKGTLCHTKFAMAGMDSLVPIKIKGKPTVMVRRGDLKCTGKTISAKNVSFAGDQSVSEQISASNVEFSDRHKDGVQPRASRLNISGTFDPKNRKYRCSISVVPPR